MPDQTPNHPVIAEIREVRRRISAQFDHDPRRMVEHYIELQERHGDRLIQSTRDSRRQETPT